MVEMLLEVYHFSKTSEISPGSQIGKRCITPQKFTDLKSSTGDNISEPEYHDGNTLCSCTFHSVLNIKVKSPAR